MSIPTVTHKALRNEATGVDVCVPGLRAEEAPLGGRSVLYEVSIHTRSNLFKNRLHTSEDVVHFTILKAYREMEDLHNKLSKKYPNASFPPIPKSSSGDSDENRVTALDQFMKVVATNVEVCYSEIFRQFIGVNSRRTSISSITSADVEKEECSDEGTNKLFPKMKNVERNEPMAAVKVPSLDLFEEEKLGVKEKPREPSKGVSPTGLFDEFEDDSLFRVKTPEKKQAVKAKDVSPPPKKPEPVKRQEKTAEEKIDDSEIIINDRKFGDVSMFDEQDFGGYVTRDEEDLFLVSSPSEDSKRNPLLLPEKEILSPETDDSVSESLDDLLKMEPLPSSPAKQESSETKPVPLPRKKSLGKVETDSLQKPEVKPRKVFLSKTGEVPKSSPAVKPALPPKPAHSKPPPPPKPKPAPKPIVRNRENQNSVPEQKADFKELDILKYIEQEQKTFDSELSLFD